MVELFIGIYILTSIMIVIHTRFAYRHKDELGKRMCKIMIMAGAIILFYTTNLLSSNYFIMSFGNSMVFITVSFLLIQLLGYVIAYTKRKPMPKLKKAIYAYAFLEALLLITNPWHELVLTYKRVYTHGKMLLLYDPKMLFIIHLIFCYLIIAIILICLIKKRFTVPKVYRAKFDILLLSIVVVVLVNYFFITSDFIVVDFSTITYGIVACILYYYTFAYKPWYVISSTQKLILEHLGSAVVLFDYEGVISDYNDAFIRLFPFVNNYAKDTMKISEFLETTKINVEGDNRTQEFDWEIVQNNEIKYYMCDYRYLQDVKQHCNGIFLTFQNVTKLKKINQELEHMIDFDMLTGFYNKYVFNKKSRDWDSTDLLPISVAICNINGLGMINDVFGTESGDEVIVILSDRIKETVRHTDFVVRLDGEDISIVMPNTLEKDAVDLLDQIKKNFNESSFFEFKVSIEYGVAVKYKLNCSLNEVVALARESMIHKKMMDESSSKSSLLDSVKQSLIESDYETEEHMKRSTAMAVKFGKKINLTDVEIGKLQLLAFLHDIGKLAVPYHILVKNSKLTEEERLIMKQHTTKGYRIAKSSPELSEVADLILSHHERWDGSGYPNSLKENEIPLLSRIISVIDAHDVMTHDRPYHKAISEEEAITELKRCSGTQFDKEIVDIFIELILDK